MKIRFVISTIIIVFGLFFVWQKADSQAQAINLESLIFTLRLSDRTAAEKNEILINGVNLRGVDFVLTAEIEKTLREAGAGEKLIRAIRAKAKRKEIKNSLGMEFVLIPKGSFMMGGNPSDKEFDKSEAPQHKVTLNYEFYLGKYEVTQAQWQAVMDDNPSKFPECGGNCPVENISWDMAKKFIEKLNARNDGFVYRLPTEAEWEYAARAGTTTQFYWGADLNYSKMCEYANVPDRTALGFDKSWNVAKCSDGYETTAPVGKFKPNAFGLYDMSGNIWEWTEDIDSPNYKNLPTDGSANLTVGEKGSRMLRGGSWAFRPWDSRLADRTGVPPTFKSYVTGFRVAFSSSWQ